MIVLASASVQEMYDLTLLAFDLSDQYRNPAMILGDAPARTDEAIRIEEGWAGQRAPKTWALTGAQGRNPLRIKSLYLKDGELSNTTGSSSEV